MKTGQIELFGTVWDVKEVEHDVLGKGIEIDFTRMYNVPEQFSFKNLFFISEYFGTKDIDWNNVSHRGCETCDWGSSYGYEIQIYNITKNYPELMEE